MRIDLDKNHRKFFFSTLKRKARVSWQKLSETLSVNNRMLRSWRSGEFTIPISLFKKVYKLYKIRMPKVAQSKAPYWYVKIAGRKGAIMRNFLYGNPGTSKGRKKGGLNSLETHRFRHTAFKMLKGISQPKDSILLAEAIGILIGDGGISKFQVTVTLDFKKDREYAYFVKSLLEKLFDVKASLIERKSDSVINVLISSRAVVDFLFKKGLPIGNKVKQEIDMPYWIKQNPQFIKACIRGIFDTDGSVYEDRHSKKKNYTSLNVAVTSASRKLLQSIYKALIENGFHPTRSSFRSVRIRRSEEVVKYFNMIGSSNPKHNRKFTKFRLEEYPSGHTGTVSKTVGV